MERIVDRTRVIRSLTLLHDVLSGGLALVAGFYLRLGEDTWRFIATPEFAVGLALFMLLTALATTAFGLNRGLWRYASLSDLIAILKSTTLVVLVFMFLMFLFSRLDAIPRTSLVITWALSILMMGGTRVAYRVWRDRRAQRQLRNPFRKSAVLVGADSSSEMFIKAVNERGQMQYSVVAVFDERDRRTGMRMRGVPVIGSFQAMDDLLARAQSEGRPVESMVLAKRHVDFAPGVLDRIIEWGGRHGLELLQAPDLRDMEARSELIEARPLRIHDLLGRDPDDRDTTTLAAALAGKTVLVTGAGGSIGSALCRQIASYQPRRIVLLEISEFNLYAIDRDLRRLAPDVEIVARLGDIRRRRDLFALFHETKPDWVFHAAALKNIGFLERQPLACLKTNVIGTCNVADAAREAGTSSVVMISTDKAVNPTQVMGTSKRMAELYCQKLDLDGETRFIVVRLGNVLGEVGSVLPLFEQQIRAGGPVTVTHPEIMRYFMTIAEATQRLLQAVQVAIRQPERRGHVHVLDMGEPVKIAMLARRMILLSGFEPDVDIPITYTGLRPGEKIFEDRFSVGEQQVERTDLGVLVGSPVRADIERIVGLVNQLASLVAANDRAGAINLVKQAVPEARLNDGAASARARPGDNVVPLRSKS